MDGIGPTQGWEIYWMEVDVKRRRGAPCAAPVPKEIAPHVRHLTAAE
jgi:phthalate 4,5-dioxygenase